MIGAGDKPLTGVQKSEISWLVENYCPKEHPKEEKECEKLLTDNLSTATEDMVPTTADAFTTGEYRPAAGEIYDGCATKHAGKPEEKTLQCFNWSVKGVPAAIKNETPGLGKLFFSDHITYLSDGYTPPSTSVLGESAYLTLKKSKFSKVPESLKTYTDDLRSMDADLRTKDVSNIGKIANQVENLYREAMLTTDPGNSEAVAEKILEWASPYIDSIIAATSGKEKGAADRTEGLLLRHIVFSVDPGSGKVKFMAIPDTLLDLGRNKKEKAQVRDILISALEKYRIKPGAEDFIATDRGGAMDALAGATAKAIKDIENRRLVKIDDIKVDSDGKVTEVVVAKKAEAEDEALAKVNVPEKLLKSLGIRSSDIYAAASVKLFWRQIEIIEPRAADKKETDLRDSLVADLLGQLGGLTPFQIALTTVTKVEDGAVTIKEAPAELLGENEGLLRRMGLIDALASLEILRNLNNQAMALKDAEGKDPKVVAKEISERVSCILKTKLEEDGAIAAAGAKLNLKIEKFDKDGKPVVEVGKVEAGESDKPSGLHGNITGGLATNGDKSSGLLEAEIGHKWKFGKNDVGYVDLTAGLVIGSQADPLGYGLSPSNSEALLLRKGVDNKKRALLMKALLAIGREEEGKVNYSGEVGVDRDDDWLEANKAILRGNIEIPLKKDLAGDVTTTLIANLGGGWLFNAFNLDPEDENQYEVGGGFVEGTLGLISDLWSGASGKLIASYMYAFDESTFSVFSAVAKFKQELGKNVDLKFTGIYAGLHDNEDMDNINVGIIKPQIAWYAAKVSEKLFVSPELTYQWVGLDAGGNSHKLDLMLYLRTRKDKAPGSFAVGIGGGHVWRNAENDIPIHGGFDTGASGEVPSVITPEPGMDGWYGSIVGSYFF